METYHLQNVTWRIGTSEQHAETRVVAYSAKMQNKLASLSMLLSSIRAFYSLSNLCDLFIKIQDIKADVHMARYNDACLVQTSSQT